MLQSKLPFIILCENPMKKLLTAFSALFIACALVACSGGNNTPQAAAKQFSEALYKGDADTVLKLLYIPEKEAKKDGFEDMMRGKMKMMVQEAKAHAEKNGGLDSVNTSEPKYFDEKKRATVQTTVKFKNGEEKKSNTKLIATDDGWKIGL